MSQSRNQIEIILPQEHSKADASSESKTKTKFLLIAKLEEHKDNIFDEICYKFGLKKTVFPLRDFYNSDEEFSIFDFLNVSFSNMTSFVIAKEYSYPFTVNLGYVEVAFNFDIQKDSREKYIDITNKKKSASARIATPLLIDAVQDMNELIATTLEEVGRDEEAMIEVCGGLFSPTSPEREDVKGIISELKQEIDDYYRYVCEKLNKYELEKQLQPQPTTFQKLPTIFDKPETSETDRSSLTGDREKNKVPSSKKSEVGQLPLDAGEENIENPPDQNSEEKVVEEDFKDLMSLKNEEFLERVSSLYSRIMDDNQQSGRYLSTEEFTAYSYMVETARLRGKLKTPEDKQKMFGDLKKEFPILREKSHLEELLTEEVRKRFDDLMRQKAKMIT